MTVVTFVIPRRSVGQQDCNHLLSDPAIWQLVDSHHRHTMPSECVSTSDCFYTWHFVCHKGACISYEQWLVSGNQMFLRIVMLMFGIFLFVLLVKLCHWCYVCTRNPPPAIPTPPMTMSPSASRCPQYTQIFPDQYSRQHNMPPPYSEPVSLMTLEPPPPYSEQVSLMTPPSYTSSSNSSFKWRETGWFHLKIRNNYIIYASQLSTGRN